MSGIVEFTDHYQDCPYRKVYTPKELGIPGLVVLGWYHSHIATKPLTNHYHRDRIEIRLIIKGNSVITANGKEYHLRGGDVFIIPANISHDSGSYPMGVCEMYWFQLHIDKPPFLFLEKRWATELQRLLGSLRAGTLRNVNFTRKYLSEMFSLLTSDSFINKYRGVSQLVNILHGIIDTRSEIQDSPSADIQKAIDFIRINIYNEIALESLADEAGLSLTRFKQKFNEQIGMPPRMFINMQKVETAQKLLAKGKSITDTAFDLGFNSSTYFATVFRNFTSLSPGEFSKKNTIQP